MCLLAFIGDALSFPDIGVLVDIMAGIGRTTFETFSTLYVTYQTDFVNPIVKNDIAHGGRDQVAMLFSLPAGRQVLQGQVRLPPCAMLGIG